MNNGAGPREVLGEKVYTFITNPWKVELFKIELIKELPHYYILWLIVMVNIVTKWLKTVTIGLL